ncbi:uncharacterized protein LOC142500249 isoform X2 [Ascaphus truei]|uniref:uncharacterized protein LOC142500249 isoform X2 n=1 Tax=Ascaphus truei TaxID=8439 RepID=UPI003F596A43
MISLHQSGCNSLSCLLSSANCLLSSAWPLLPRNSCGLSCASANTQDSNKMEQKTKRRGRPPQYSPEAKKRRRAEIEKQRNGRRILIGNAYEDWMTIKEEKCFKTNEEVAVFLIKSYKMCIRFTEIKELRNSAVKLTDNMNTEPENPSSRTTLSLSGPEIPTGYLNVSADAAESDSHSEDIDELELDPTDESYQSAEDFFNYTPPSTTELEQEDCDSCSEEDGADCEHTISFQNRSADDSCENHSNPQAFIIYDNCLLSFLKSVFKVCIQKTCNEKMDIVIKGLGTALHVIATCQNNHIFDWWSQPIVQRVPLANIQLPSSIIFSGNNFQKIKLMCRFMNMACVGKATFFSVERKYVYPIVLDHWRQMQQSILSEMKEPLIVMGDCRSDCPGLSSKYQTCTMMDYSTKKIVDIKVIDTQDVTGESSHVEILALKKSLEFIISKGIAVTEIITDTHSQIKTYMKENYPNIQHQIDICHGEKAVLKRLLMVARKRRNIELMQWTKDIQNIFLLAIRNCKRNHVVLHSIWRSILFHVVNIHAWPISLPGGIDQCFHGELGECNKHWITQNSSAHLALAEVVYDQWFTSHLQYFTNGRSASEFKCFHNLSLTYAANTFAFQDEVYLMRSILAAIDHNHHIDEARLSSQQGREHLRHKSQCCVTVKKDYKYIPSLMTEIIHQSMILQDNREVITSTNRTVSPPSAAQLVVDQLLKRHIKEQQD